MGMQVDCRGHGALESKHARAFYLAILWVCSISAVFSKDDQTGSGVTLVPTIGKLGPLQTTAVWQLPKGPAEKVFVIFEARWNLPTDFWDRSPSCIECRGLPEKRKLVADALSRNYAVFVPKSVVEPDGDWGSWPVDNPDLENALSMLDEWKSMHGLENLPTVAMGCSAGGHAVSTLGLRPGLFESIAIVISRGTVEAFEAATHEYPPTIFVHMPKDTATADLVANARRILGSKGVSTQETRWYQHPVTPDWFSQIIPGVDLGLSTAVHNNVRAEGWLDYQTNLLTSENFKDNWSDDVRRRKLLPRDAGGLLLQDCILDEMDVAFAKHITIARNDNETFAWLDGGYNLQKSGAATIKF